MLRQQVLVNHASPLHPEVVAAHQAKDVKRFELASRQFLQMIRDIDQLLATLYKGRVAVRFYIARPVLLQQFPQPGLADFPAIQRFQERVRSLHVFFFVRPTVLGVVDVYVPKLFVLRVGVAVAPSHSLDEGGYRRGFPNSHTPREKN